MEVLNYSLWFTLVWLMYCNIYVHLTQDKSYRNYILSLFDIIIVPIVAILLEYLIMRQ